MYRVLGSRFPLLLKNLLGRSQNSHVATVWQNTPAYKHIEAETFIGSSRAYSTAQMHDSGAATTKIAVAQLTSVDSVDKNYETCSRLAEASFLRCTSKIRIK